MNSNQSSRLTEEQLRQVQQQQELFQQHLLNMQRHLEEQQRQFQNQREEGEGGGGRRRIDQRESSSESFSPSLREERNKSQRHLHYQDDHDEIVQLIERDPYFAAAMEDFVRSHGLLDHSSSSSSSSSSTSSSSSSSISSRSSSRSSLTSVTNESTRLTRSDLLLLNEIRGIRHLMKKYFQEKQKHREEFRREDLPRPDRIRYPPVEVVTDVPRSLVPPRESSSTSPRSNHYENLVQTMKEMLKRRPSSEQDRPLKPSDIDPKYKYRPKRPVSHPSSKPPLPSREPFNPISSVSPSSSLSKDRPPRIPPAPPLPPSLNFSNPSYSVRSD